MRKLLLLFAILLVCAPAGFAQTDYSHWEFFIGLLEQFFVGGEIRGKDKLSRESRDCDMSWKAAMPSPKSVSMLLAY